MQWLNNHTRYGLLSLTLHWLMVALMIAVFASIELRVLYPKGTELRDAFKHWHFMLGLTVFLLVWIRLGLIVMAPKPEILPPLPAYQVRLSKLIHGVLYLLMILMPIGGWLILSGEGKPIPWFGLSLPALINPNKELAQTIESFHETFGLIGYGLITLHALAGLAHHYLFNDNTLTRMLPYKK